MSAIEPRQGNEFQDDFKELWESQGKKAWIYRFKDAAQNFGRNKRLVLTDEQPADFLCAYAGYLGLVECKSTRDPRGLRRSLIRRGQLKSAVESTLSGTPYHFAVRNENTKQIFLLPAALVLQKPTVLWKEMQDFEWKVGARCFPM